MRALRDLLATPLGRDLLVERGIDHEPDRFLSRLCPPRRNDLADAVGVPGRPLVWTGHQLLADYAPPVRAKLRCLGAVARSADVGTVAVWLDTDRVGSDHRATTVTWPEDSGGGVRIRLVPRKEKDGMVALTPVAPDAVARLGKELGRWVDDHVPPSRRVAAHERLARLIHDIPTGDGVTLADVNAAITAHTAAGLVGGSTVHLRVSAPAVVDAIVPSIERLLDHRDEVIRVFNEFVQQLQDEDIDPQVRPLPSDYLPLHIACPRDGRRVRLVHELRGGAHIALAACPCGEERRLPLGRSGTRLDALRESARWSVDVTLPLHLEDHVSGVVAGRSSALYGLVLGAVRRRIYGADPVPVLVPAELASVAADGSLLREHLLS